MKFLQYTLLFIFASVFTLHASKPEARFNLLRINYTLNTDGSTDYHFRKELTLFTHTAMNRTYGETFITYNPDFQDLTINEAYTIQKEGNKIALPKNALIPVLPHCVAGAPDFNHLKEMVVVHTGLELGATIFLDYTIHTKNGLYPFFDINDCLQQASPIKNCEVTISYPSSHPVAIQIIGRNTSAKITKNNEMITDRYVFKNIPARSREAYQATYDQSVLRIIASEIDIAKALKNVKNKFEGTVPTILKAAADKLITTKETKIARIKTLRSFVAQNFSVKHIPYNLNAISLRHFNRIYDSHYATTLEEASLLYNLLRSEDFQANLIAVIPAYIESRNCGLGSVTNWIVRAQDNLSSSVENIQGACYYTLDGTKLNLKSKQKKIINKKTLLVSEGKKNNAYTLLPLPTFKNGVDAWRMNTLPTTRKTVLEIPSRIAEESIYTIDIDNDAHFLASKYNKEITNSAGEFSQNIEVQGTKIIVNRKINLDKNYFTPKEYKKLRVLLNEWYDTNNHLLVFSN